MKSAGSSCSASSASLQRLARRLARAGRLRSGLGDARATSLESFLWLRHEYRLSLRQTRDTIAEPARQVLRG